MFLEQFPGEGRQHGWIEVVCGSMFSGKTEELIRRMRRAEFANQRMVLFKPQIDNRYSEENVVSHQGSSLKAIVVNDSSEILATWRNELVVAIDEAQFFDFGIVEVCNTLASKGVRVILAGLDMDYLGVPFGPMPQLLSIADYITKVHAICIPCGDIALHSFRKVSNDKTVLLGEKESYEPRCRKCFEEGMKAHGKS